MILISRSLVDNVVPISVPNPIIIDGIREVEVFILLIRDFVFCSHFSWSFEEIVDKVFAVILETVLVSAVESIKVQE